MSRDSNNFLLRQQYTGEPRQAAIAFYQARGQYFGLIPDAGDPQQQLLEAAVMLTLARPRLPELTSPDPLFGLRGVSPDIDQLVLWPDPDHVPELLARLLPVRTEAGIAGIAGLRARPPAGRTDTLLLARPGHRAQLTVRARRRDLAAAEQWAKDSDLEPLWTDRTPQAGENAAWAHLAGTIPPEERALWSRALRRIALRKEHPADWTQRPPTRHELDGPKPQRIAARPVGPAGGPARGIIAVTSASGQAGKGCTTAALALAAALARTGTQVAFLGTGAEDPNGLSKLLHGQLPPSGVFTDLAANLPGRGALRAMTLPTNAAHAKELLAEASSTHDTVVLDAGAGFRLRHLVEHADTVIALAPYQPNIWGHTEDTARLLEFLDMMFADYVEYRTEVEDLHEVVTPDVYVSDDPNDVTGWWAEYEHGIPAADDWPGLPDESATGHLDTWRHDFLTFLDPEGRRRHPATWEAATKVWAARNRAGNTRRLHPGEAENDLTAYLDEHDIKVVRHLAEPAHITSWLLRQFDHLAEAEPTLLVSRVPEDVDQHQLTEVREGLRAHGIPDIVIWPELDELGELRFDITRLTNLSDEAAAAATHLAVAAANRLAAHKGTAK